MRKGIDSNLTTNGWGFPRSTSRQITTGCWASKLLSLTGRESFGGGNRQAAHIQTFKIGPELKWSQCLLNEIAQAKICLLNAAAKAEYDQSLRKSLVPIASMATPPIIALAVRFPTNVPRSREPCKLTGNGLEPVAGLGKRLVENGFSSKWPNQPGGR